MESGTKCAPCVSDSNSRHQTWTELAGVLTRSDSSPLPHQHQAPGAQATKRLRKPERKEGDGDDPAHGVSNSMGAAQEERKCTRYSRVYGKALRSSRRLFRVLEGLDPQIHRQLSMEDSKGGRNAATTQISHDSNGRRSKYTHAKSTRHCPTACMPWTLNEIGFPPSQHPPPSPTSSRPPRTRSVGVTRSRRIPATCSSGLLKRVTSCMYRSE